MAHSCPPALQTWPAPPRGVNLATIHNAEFAHRKTRLPVGVGQSNPSLRWGVCAVSHPTKGHGLTCGTQSQKSLSI